MATTCNLPKPRTPHKPSRLVSIVSIFQIMKPNFLLGDDLFKMAAISPIPDEHFMNLNFAFACMIVVSFTIALVHT